MAFFLVALLVAGGTLAGVRMSPAMRAWLTRIAAPTGACVAALVMLFVLQLACVAYAAYHAQPTQSWERALPLRVAHDDGPVSLYADALAALMAIFAVVTSAVLVALARALECEPGSSRDRTVVGVGVVVMALLGLCSPVLSSADLYANVGYALLGHAAYLPPAQPLPASFDVINRWWGTPMVASPYGPLWLAIVRAATVLPASLFGKLIALRIAAALAAFGFLSALRAFKVRSSIVALAALNPVLWMQYVANAHADIVAMFAIGVAAVWLLRRPAASVAAITVAALIKAPYALAGLALFAVLPSRMNRLLASCATLALVGTTSLAFGGPAYVRAITEHVVSRAPEAFALAHVLAASAGLAALGVVLWRGASSGGAVWLFPAFSAGAFPWYLGFALPAALTSPQLLRSALIVAPVGAFLLDGVFARPWTLPVSIVCASCYLVVAVYQGGGRRPA